ALSTKVIGNLASDDQKIKKIGVPLGVVAVILPGENIILNTLFTLLSGLKAGNAVILIPQEKTANIVAKLFHFLTPEQIGLPKFSYSFMENTTSEGVKTIMSHDSVALVINIDAPDYFEGQNKIKPIVYGANGSTPVFIERTANVYEACEAIISSRSFDNGLLPASEQFVIAEGVIAKEAKAMMIQAGAHFMSAKEEEQLLSRLFINQETNPLVVGKDAKKIAALAGFSVSEKTKVLVSEQLYILEENPFTTALKCPILTFYLESDWIHACDKCIQLLKEKRNGHTLAIHSHDQRIIEEFALKKPIGRMIVNAGASLAGIGLESTLPLSLVLGGMTTGRGIAAQNITAQDLRYVREIGYVNDKVSCSSSVEKTEKSSGLVDEQALLEKFLQKIIEQ
ncbi:aldehyde dehydrogenase family protein, partial [Enterococcus sp.]